MNYEELLRRRGLPFETIIHDPTFDAQHLAQAVHESGDLVAKTVLLRTEKQFVVAVLQATHQIDLEKARKALQAHRIEIASELDVYERFPDCEIGSPPAFGSLYGMTTLVDQSLTKDDTIVFKAKTNDEAIRMKYSNFADFEKPLIADIAE